MKQNDFEKLFHNQLKGLSPDDFPFEEKAWDEVENTLNKEGILTPSKRKWGDILPFTLLLLVLSNGLVGWKYYNAEQEIQTLNATVLQLENDLDGTLSQKGTTNTEAEIMPSNNVKSAKPNIQIIEKIVKIPVEKIVEKIVYIPVSSQTNTQPSIANIHTGNIPNHTNTVVKPNDLKNNTSKNNVVLNQNNHEGKINGLENINTEGSKMDASNLSDKYTNTKHTTDAITQSKHTTNKTDTDKLDKNTLVMSTNQIIEEIGLTELALIELVTIDNVFEYPLNIADLNPLFDTTSSEKKRTLADRLRYIDAVVEVSNYELGISSGIDFMYQGTDFSLFSSRYGITNELSISEYVKIGATVDWKETTLELENITQGTYPDDYFDIFPNLVSSVDPNDLLNKIEYRDRAIEFSLFAKYILKPHNKLTPYLGAGIKGEYDYEQRFEYAFLDANSSLEYESDYLFTNNKQFGFNTLIGLVGAEYNLTPSITLRIDGMYNYDYQPHRFDNSQLQWFSGNLRILYKFK